MKELTSSLYDFERLINGDYLYVDKTEYVWEMVRHPYACYFLSRPRRFGKSLLLSTLKAVFEGKRELFKGLALYDKPYDWQQYPVIHIDLGDCCVHNESELRRYLTDKLRDIAESFDIKLTVRLSQLSGSFSRLIAKLANQGRQVVVLIDEYDKPILENITRADDIGAIRDTLADFYSPLKTQQSYERFVFLTGVSKFCHVSIFSKLNNLTDITMDARFATMLGYTQEEFENNFAEYIAQTEANQNLPHEQYLDKIKRWYDGFRFHAKADTVYNPVSLANFFTNCGEFNNYWFATGTTSFLIELIKQQKFDFEEILKEPVSQIAFSAYDVNNLEILPLLMQTGYLTINHVQQNDDETLYYLDFPNLEVKEGFQTYLINAYTKATKESIEVKVRRLKRFVREGDVDGFMQCLQSLLAGIPYSIQIKEEKDYQTVVFLIFTLLGVYTTAEAQTNTGRIDAVAACDNYVYIFEFKLNKSEEVAFDQIMARQYYQKYQNCGKQIVLIGANFDFEKRQIDGWKTKLM